MPNKTIYVSDVRLWCEVRRVCVRRGLSLSSVISELLRLWIAGGAVYHPAKFTHDNKGGAE